MLDENIKTKLDLMENRFYGKNNLYFDISLYFLILFQFNHNSLIINCLVFKLSNTL